MKRRHEDLERADWRAALVASILINVNRAENAESVAPEDLMPTRQRKPEPYPDDPAIRDQYIRLQAQLLNVAFGGVETPRQH